MIMELSMVVGILKDIKFFIIDKKKISSQKWKS
jgi:hypothetical protein